MAAAAPRPFGALLKRYRQAAGLTQEALAGQAGLSIRTISDLERGLTGSASVALRGVCPHLQLSFDEQVGC
jgi:transcriptional regulator with XRE-family HTH domain